MATRAMTRIDRQGPPPESQTIARGRRVGVPPGSNSAYIVVSAALSLACHPPIPRFHPHPSNSSGIAKALTKAQKNGNILPMKPKILTKTNLETLFAQLDAAALQEAIEHRRFIIIGSAILIQDGMPERFTLDVDFWKTTPQDHDVLQRMAQRVGVDFNPKDDLDRVDPYLRWLSPEFVHMPLNESWREQTETVWAGRSITIERPPIGIVLGSKLAAGRQQDFIDAQYIVQAYPEWRENLKQWIGEFSTEDQEDIQDNLVFVNLYLAQDPEKSKKPSKKKLL